MKSLRRKGKTFKKVLKEEGILGIRRRVVKLFRGRQFNEGPYIKDVDYSPDIKFFNYDDIQSVLKKYQRSKLLY